MPVKMPTTEALLITTEGGIYKILMPCFAGVQIKTIQFLVGGWFQDIRLHDDLMMLVNEEGQILEMPFNITASWIAGHPVLGNAIITGYSLKNSDLKDVDFTKLTFHGSTIFPDDEFKWHVDTAAKELVVRERIEIANANPLV